MSVSSNPSAAAADGEPPLRLEVQRVSDDPDIPDDERLSAWVGAALKGRVGPCELTVRLVDEPESAALNRAYRGKDSPTNVLSFPLDMPPETGIPYLGDLVICTPVVRREAAEQGKSLESHYAHMLVHGILHLLGYDHHSPREAREMEALEAAVMTRIGFSNPYDASDQE
jgi:probable rRNA maturation factor